MKLYFEALKLLFRKLILRKDNGTVVRKFCEKMGIVYIKLAQILATQNYGNIFTEEDRKMLAGICDDCNPIPFEEIEDILKLEYGENLYNIFTHIYETPVGSASISQVHRAILKSGEEVAIKVRRKDITDNIEKDIKKIRKIVHRYGRLFKFANFIGADKAFELYFEWIKEEIDFEHERNNIKLYQSFADNVNNKVDGTKEIKVPKLYEEYCTKNIIVMEFIKYKTINKLELTEENNNKINDALNSYLKLSIWALLGNKKVVFHADPHSGNIYIDDEGNVGFLDMGLLFAIEENDAELIRKFFLAAYSGNSEKLYNMLEAYCDFDDKKKLLFKEDLKKTVEGLKKKDITCYFTDVMNICLYYEFLPPNFLFCMAKAFLCLNGINNFSNNKCSARELLGEQVIEYMLKRSITDCKNIAIDGIITTPKLLISTLKNGVVKTIAKESANKDGLKKDIITSIENLKEMLETVEVAYCEEVKI